MDAASLPRKQGFFHNVQWNETEKKVGGGGTDLSFHIDLEKEFRNKSASSA